MSAANATPLHIGLIGPMAPPSGGMAAQTQQLAELLRTAGHGVTLVPVNAPYWPRWVARVPVLRAPCRLLPYLVALWRLAGRVDVFHIMANSGWSWHLFAAPALWLGRWRGVPVLVNYRGGEAADFLQRRAALVRLSMRCAQALLVPSGFLQRVFSDFDMAAEIVPNIIDLARFQPRQPLHTDTPHLLVARNLEPLYDNETAIRAFKLVRDRFPQARLTLAGSGPQEAFLRELVQTLGLGDSVQWTGRVEHQAMAALYRSADVLLNPSRADNMPNSLLEAWASGVPVVSTNVGGIGYLAQDGVTASLVPPADPTAMAQACVRLLSDEALWSLRAQAGLQQAQRYSWAQVQPVLMAVYRRVVPARHTVEKGL